MRTHKTVAISLPPDLHSQALIRAASLGFSQSFSAYLQHLIRADIAESAPLAPLRETSPRYTAATERTAEQTAQILAEALKRLTATQQNNP